MLVAILSILAFVFMSLRVGSLAYLDRKKVLNPIKYTVSDYAATKIRKLYGISSSLNFLGIAFLTFAITAIHYNVPTYVYPFIVSMFLFPFIRIFHIKAPHRRHVKNNHIHVVLAAADFVVKVSGISLIESAVSKFATDWTGIILASWSSTVLAELSLVALFIAFVVKPIREKYVGLVERILIYDISAWILLVSLMLILH